MKDKTELIEIKCDQCGEKIQRKRHRVERNNHSFCSKDCFSKWMSEWMSVDYKVVECDNCGKEIERKPYRIKNQENHFCNKECFNKWKKEQNKEKYKKETVECDYCGKETKKTRINIKKSEHDFCSRDCLNKWRKNRKLSSTPSFYIKNQYKNVKRNKYFKKDWKTQRKLALERDNHRCSKCGKKEENCKLDVQGILGPKRSKQIRKPHYTMQILSSKSRSKHSNRRRFKPNVHYHSWR